jgi:MFS transporter, PAT family, beta-lactamase induction signal transducer AmpG
MLDTPDREQSGQRIRRRRTLDTGDIGRDATSQRDAHHTTPDLDAQSSNSTASSPGFWVPSSYFAEGVPFAMVIWVAGTMFKDLGHSDTEITIATATVGIAWSLKPLWAAFLDMARTKKFFVIAMEIAIAALLVAISLALGAASYFAVIIALLWVMAFASATQDICVDGIYVTSLDERRQAAWIGMQGTAWNAGRIFGTAAVVFVAGALQRQGMPARAAWSWALLVAALVMAALAAYHAYMLPTGSVRRHPGSAAEVMQEFVASVRAFFSKDAIWGMLAFVLLFRAGEGFLLVEAPLFLQADPAQGGLGLPLESKSLIDGTLSTAVSIVGGLLGGKFIERFGLRRTLVFMALCLNVPHVCYVVLSHLAASGHPVSFGTVALLVCIEKFGYSFGFVANMLYMMQQIAPGEFKMTHYAFATALMNLMLIPTQSASGPLADAIGYQAFFLVVMAASIPSILVAWLAPFPRRAEVTR